MEQDEIENIAEQFGWGQGNTWDDCMCCSTFDLEAFAKLVDAKATAKEREACAKVCDAKYEEYPDEEQDLAFSLSAKQLAAAIRARGTNE